jgi:V/A-type H+-transporting ATPase subunit B
MAEAKISKEYKTVSQIAGPLIYVKKTEPVGYKEMVNIRLSDGTTRRGQVLDSSEEVVVVQVFEGTSGIDRDASVRFLGETMKMPVSRDMLGRILSGSGQPLDGGAPIVPEKELEINGAAINPWARDSPSDFIQTGISTIDGMNTLVRGQKLPIFSASGLPHNEIALQIARQAKVRGENEEFAVVFIAMGITNEEKQMFMKEFERTGALKNAVVFLNLADDPAVERTLTPRLGLTTAEYMAFDLGMQVLVIMTDITNYCEALRQIGAAREEVPGRRGYPGYMYTDLAQLYERAGRIKGKKGSITQIPILSMPGGDITHPIPDLSGYITEGQIVLSMDLHRNGIYPPVNVSSSLSRLMGGGTGEGRTREDHKGVSDQLYAAYAEGKDLRGLVAIVGKDSLSAKDRKLLDFADLFEDRFVRQGPEEDRSIEQTLDLGWELFTALDLDQITRISRKYIEKYLPKKDLHRNGIYPPVNVSSSLSRLMGGGTGEGRTREDHKGVSDQLYAAYAEGKDLRGLVAIVGKESLSAKDRKLLDFADLFEDRFVRQGPEEDRSIEETLDLGWELFTALDLDQITRISRKYIEKYMPKKA